MSQRKPLQFGVWLGSTNEWSFLEIMAPHMEETGWDMIWLNDHFMPTMRAIDKPDHPEDATGPRNETWTTMGALAHLTSRVRLGHLVTGNTYRHPAVLAKMAASVDIISGGRLVLGIGAGWQENEHVAYGIPFYTTGERIHRLDEACQIILSLFHNDYTTFDGRYYQLKDAPLSPKPIQKPHPPLHVGVKGEKVSLGIAARYADQWDVPGDVEVFAHKSKVLDKFCAEVGRDPAEIKRVAHASFYVSDDPRAGGENRLSTRASATLCRQRRLYKECDPAIRGSGGRGDRIRPARHKGGLPAGLRGL